MSRTNLVEFLKGVLVHSFFDQSGCVLYSESTGETLALGITVETLADIILDFKLNKSLNNENEKIIKALQVRKFLNS
jgi:hypothetical protein